MSDDTVFSFLITTDNHMGFKEDDFIRRKDSYMAFDEALKIARDRDADFVLLGGDLFHVNKPSASIEHKCIKIIRKHMNERPNEGTSFRRVNGNFSHFHRLNHANFEDPNFTVSCPIMTIHGNHDDPTGPNAQSVCKKLATCGLLNYFGAVGVDSPDSSIQIEPIVFQKGKIKLALYGLGFIPDYKLKMAFDKNQVIFIEPPKDTFNILVVHQNRIPFLKSKYIPDEVFPTFFHLIIRGHEHQTQLPEPIPASEVNGYVYQPGSTVATSISTMEAAPKKVGLFKVRLNDVKANAKSLYKMSYDIIDLKCCRSMIFKDITQRSIFDHIKSTMNTNKVNSEEYRRYSREYVGELIKEELKNFENSFEKIYGKETNSKLSRFKTPLVRIRLEYVTKRERFDELDLSSQFYPERVANKDIILFKKQKLVEQEGGEVENATFKLGAEEDEEDDDGDYEHIDLSEEKRDTIDVMIENFFKDQPPENRLQALSLMEYTNAVRGSSEDGNVISKVLSKKRQDVLRRYKGAIGDEELARENFHDENQIENWFINAFDNPERNTAAEIYQEIMFCD